MANPTTADGVTRKVVTASDKFECTGLTPLGLAVTKGNVPATQMLINYAPEHVNVQDNSGNTALHYAVAKCDATIAGLLMSTSTINPNIVNSSAPPQIVGDWLCADAESHHYRIKLKYVSLSFLGP